MSFHKYDGEAITIVEWANMFKNLYAEVDAPRKPEEYWNAVMAHISSIGEAIRRSHYPELLKSAASTFCWLCSYITKCNSSDDLVFHFEDSLSEIVGLKFPTVCGHCEKSPCQCDPAQMDEETEKSAKYKRLYELGREKNIDWNAYTISQWLNLLREIYGGRIHLQTMESLGFHRMNAILS